MVIHQRQGIFNCRKRSGKWEVVMGLVYLLYAPPVFSGGAAVTGVAPRAQSMQAFTAVADDASAVYYNPAGLAQLTGRSVDLGATAVLPNQTYTNPQGVKTKSRKKALGPNFFYADSSIFEKVSWGVGFYAPFARATNYTNNASTFNFPHNAKIVRIDLTPTIAFPVMKIVLLGFGLVGSYTSFDTNVFGFSESSSGYGLSAQAGALIKLTDAFTIGAVYRSRQVAKLKGRGEAGALRGRYRLDLNYPTVINLGVAWQATSNLLLSFDLETQNWSSLDKIIRRYDDPAFAELPTTTVVDGKRSYNYRAGMKYRCQDHEARLGYSYLQAGIPAANIIAAMPDYNAHAFSAGYSYYYRPMRFDFGYEFNTGSANNRNVAAMNGGKYDVHANLAMLGLSYQF